MHPQTKRLFYPDEEPLTPEQVADNEGITSFENIPDDDQMMVVSDWVVDRLDAADFAEWIIRSEQRICASRGERLRRQYITDHLREDASEWVDAHIDCAAFAEALGRTESSVHSECVGIVMARLRDAIDAQYADVAKDPEAMWETINDEEPA